MRQAPSRISFRNYSKVVEEKGRRALQEPPRRFGTDLSNLDPKQRDVTADHNQRKTVLKIRSSSFNGRFKEQIPKSAVSQYQSEIT